MSFNFKDFNDFNYMITPAFIKVIFWFGAGVCVIVGLNSLTGMTAIIGILILFLGPIIVRIYCELLVVIFKIKENLETIAKKQQ